VQLLRINRVAEVLDVGLGRAYELISSGLLPAVRLGRQVRVSDEVLRDFIRTGGRPLPGGWRRGKQPITDGGESNE
jgi:excisionase family DNA binding protein